MKKISTLFITSVILSTISFAQDTSSTFLYTDVFNQMKKENKALKQELKNYKLIPQQSIIARYHEGYDSMTLYTQERVTVSPFVISAFEITNEEYTAFTNYVRDSIASELLGYYKVTSHSETIDWKKKIDWSSQLTFERVDRMVVAPENRIFGKKTIDVNKLIYTYRIKNKDISIPIYPDTICWLKDNYYSYNEPMSSNYYSHPAYKNYPVVGVNYFQAVAFCDWKTQQLKKYLPKNFEYDVTYTLPTENEWESAADGTLYKDTNQLRTIMDRPHFFNRKNKGEYNCNFFTIEDKNGFTIKYPADDGAFYTAQVDAYTPNRNELYNMNGNVAEWTLNNGEEDVKHFIKQIDFTNDAKSHRLKWNEYVQQYPDALFAKMPLDSFLILISKLKVVKGGGWNSTPYYLQRGANQYYDPAKATSFIGFRCVMHIKRKYNPFNNPT